MDKGVAPLLLLLEIKIQHNNESKLLSSLPLMANCADSLLRNKAKNALSLAIPFSLGKAGAKIGKIWIVQGKTWKKDSRNGVIVWKSKMNTSNIF